MIFLEFEVKILKFFNFSNLSLPYLFMIIFAIGFYWGNLIKVINNKTIPKALKIILALGNLNKNTFHCRAMSYNKRWLI